MHNLEDTGSLTLKTIDEIELNLSEAIAELLAVSKVLERIKEELKA